MILESGEARAEMTDHELHDLINGDPAAKALADAGDDSGCAARVSAIAARVTVSTLITERTVFAAFTSPFQGEEVLQRLEIAALSNAVVARAIRWLKPGEGGLDIGHHSTRAMLDALQGAEVLTAEQVMVIKALGEQPQAIHHLDVARVWRGSN